MRLILKNDGFIYYHCNSSKREILLNNDDVSNLLFSNIFVQENFNFNSLFVMLNNYPILQTLFPLIKDYISEFESILELNTSLSKYAAILTPIHKFYHQMSSYEIACDVYNTDSEYEEDLNISLMKLKDYSNFNISLNILSAIENEIEDTSEMARTYLQVQIEDYYTLVSFLKVLVDKITAFGTVSERNNVIEQLEQEQKELEVEADLITAELMKKFNPDPNKGAI